jgi:hypothetical protein
MSLHVKPTQNVGIIPDISHTCLQTPLFQILYFSLHPPVPLGWPTAETCRSIGEASVLPWTSIQQQTTFCCRRAWRTRFTLHVHCTFSGVGCGDGVAQSLKLLSMGLPTREVSEFDFHHKQDSCTFRSTRNRLPRHNQALGSE